MTAETDRSPTVYEAVNSVMREITHLSKDGENKHFKFNFRSIDALLGAVAQPLRNHGVIIAPRLKSVDSELIGNQVRTIVEMEYVVYGPRGDSFTVCYPGEAADQGDKSVGKACSYAFKTLCFVLFAIPVDAESADDPDNASPQIDYSQRRQRPQSRTARTDDTGRGARSAQARTAQEIAEEALTATNSAHVRRFYMEAQGAQRLEDTVTPPEGQDGEPMPLRALLLNLKTNLEQAS